MPQIAGFKTPPKDASNTYISLCQRLGQEFGTTLSKSSRVQVRVVYTINCILLGDPCLQQRRFVAELIDFRDQHADDHPQAQSNQPPSQANAIQTQSQDMGVDTVMDDSTAPLVSKDVYTDAAVTSPPRMRSGYYSPEGSYPTPDPTPDKRQLARTASRTTPLLETPVRVPAFVHGSGSKLAPAIASLPSPVQTPARIPGPWPGSEDDIEVTSEGVQTDLVNDAYQFC
jgi:hypothetical protein